MKIPPLQKEWEERNKLRGEGNKLRDEGRKLCEEGWKLWGEGNKLIYEGYKLWREGDKLWIEGYKLWNNAVIKYYGKDAKVTWRLWHEDNEPTCHVGSDVYV